LQGVALRAPSREPRSWRSQMQGGAPQSMPLSIVEAHQRRIWPHAAGTLWARDTL